ncbi:MAG: hypothetical protein WCQ41_06155 [Bacillota bacterium]
MFNLFVSAVQKIKSIAKKNGGWGIAELLALIVGVVVVVAIVAPAVKLFSNDVISSMVTWWDDISASLFGA